MKNRVILLLTFTAFIVVFSGCGAAMATKSTEFPKMYEEQPRSILILPPMNNSSDAEAKDYYMTTVEMPFALMGYYTFPAEMVADIMKQEGVYDTELLYNMPLEKFYEYFGADTVLFTTINTAAADYVDYAKQANKRIIYSLPAGPYSPMYMQDQNVQIVDQTPPSN